jgi:deoxyadenosine/deoxycytidine kinase
MKANIATYDRSIMPPLVVVVEAIIAAGKVTYITMIRDHLVSLGKKVVVVPEPVDKWEKSELLLRFYADPRRWAYHFQTKAFHDRVVVNQQAYETHGDDVDYYLLERSPLSDKMFMNVLHERNDVDDLEMKDYGEWWSMWNRMMPYKPTHFIFLNPSIKVCMIRLSERGRPGEDGVTFEYQLSLQKQHELFFAKGFVTIDEKNVPVIRLDTDENFRDERQVREKMCRQFVESIY